MAMKIIHENMTMRKTAVVTGATSGIGRDIARLLGERGYHLLLTGRNEDELSRLCDVLGRKNVTAVSADLSDMKECGALYRYARQYNTEVLINNAGFGLHGEFVEANLKTEMKMLDVNVRAVHILMKLFLRDFVKRNKGYILNVASVAGFVPGPFMSGYYATKSYVISMSESVYEELRHRKSRVKISVLCPGPVDTEFNRRAGVTGSFSGISSEEAASEAVEGLFSGKLLIVPTSKIKLIAVFGRMLPAKLVAAANYYVQGKKKKL